MKKKGEITVFLALILSVLLGFYSVVITSIKIFLIKSELTLAADAAMKSCFAEYNQRLYERFHLMYIDPSYKTNTCNSENTIDHFIFYMDGNLNSNNKISHLGVDGVDVIEIKSLAENKSELYSEINDYMKRAGANYFANESDNFRRYLCENLGDCEDSQRNPYRVGEKEYLVYGYENDNINIQLANDEYADYCNKELEKIVGSSSRYYFPWNVQTISYRDYLESKIEDIDQEVLRERFENLVEEDVRSSGNPAFELDECIVALKVCATAITDNGRTFLVESDYEY